MDTIHHLQKQQGTALVLSGGATKAFYFHLGVLQALKGEPISSIVGSSAGAVAGALVAAGVTSESMLTALYQKQAYVPKFDKWIRTLNSTMLFRPRLDEIASQAFHNGLAGIKFLSTLPKVLVSGGDVIGEALDLLVDSQTHVSGFFDSVALEALFRALLPSQDFRQTDIDLYLIATALDEPIRAVFNGKYNFKDEHNHFMTDVPIHKAVRASTTIPAMFDPVKVKGRYYVDGEIKKTLSVDIALNLADRVIVSHTYQPLRLEGVDSVNSMGWVNIVKQSTSIVFQERIAIWRQLYEERYPDKQIIWIQPEPDDIEFFLTPEFSFRPEVQRRMVQSGENAALKALSETLDVAVI